MIGSSGAMSDPFSRHSFSGNPLDRADNLRDDDRWIARQRRAAGARVVVFSGERPAIRVGGANAASATIDWRPLDDVSAMDGDARVVFLGLDDDGEARFAAEINAQKAPSAPTGDVKNIDLRSLAIQDLLTPTELGMLGHARSLLNWHGSHRFCANCGAETVSSAGGSKRRCGRCGHEHFPRVDPVMIMIAAHEDHCLLGRQAQFEPGVYSALAGFVEPGESLEEAARREVLEEAGVVLDDVRYHSSQPWPFPSSLMIGCMCHAAERTLAIDRNELEDARWFSRDEVRSMLAGNHPEGLRTPTRMAIAYHLVRAFAEDL